MLIGKSRPKPDLQQIRHIKAALRQALKLVEDDTITVSELACLEEGCAPVETVLGLLRVDGPQVQHKLHKPMDSIDADDLTEVCKAWGFGTHNLVLESFKQET
jgi:hypothetical protein